MKLHDSKMCASPTTSTSNAGNELDVFKKACPSSLDETHQMCRMAFSNVSTYALLSGWSLYIPVKFFHLQPSTRLGKVLLESGELNPKAKVLLESDERVSLRELEDVVKIPGAQKNVTRPIYVQVVAKRKIDVIPFRGNQVLVLSLMVVADESGYCVLSSFNEGVEVFYNAAEVGDHLLISRAEIKPAQKDYHRGLFADNFYLNLEIKVQFLQARTHFLNKFDSSKMSQFKIPPALFGESCEIRLPSDLNDSEEVQPATSRQQPRFFDIIGVINYVGRLQRFTLAEPMVIEDDKFITRDVPRFLLYRWITVVDKTSKPIEIKLFVYSTSFQCQSSVIPGAMVVLTNLRIHDDPLTTRKYYATTDLSQVYFDVDLWKYFMMRPKEFIEKAEQIMRRANYIEILTRKNVSWAAGGTLTLKASSDARLLDSYNEKRSILSNVFPQNRPFKRRESRFYYLSGTIYRASKYFKENAVSTILYTHPNYVSAFRNINHQKKLDTYHFDLFHKNQYWYSFIRRLPPLDPQHLEEKKATAMGKKVVLQYQKYCKSLLMPAEIDEGSNTSDGYPPLASLEMIDGPPLFYLDIFDERSQNWYTCMWKSVDYSVDEMLKKVMEARGKKIAFLLDVYCIEEGYPLEVVLQDFAVLPQ